MPQQKYSVANLPLNDKKKNQLPNVIVDFTWFVAPRLSQVNMEGSLRSSTISRRSKAAGRIDKHQLPKTWNMISIADIFEEFNELIALGSIETV